MLKLLLCEDWLANRDEILKRLARDVAERQGERILLVPELISHDMERRLCRWAGDTASRYAQVLSFTRLARRVAESVGAAAEECLDKGGRVVAMAAAGRQLSGSSFDADALRKEPALALDYIIAPPRMALYMQTSAQIYQIYLKYIAPEDLHVD